MKALSLFSGIDGFGLALERAGMTVAGQVEMEFHSQSGQPLKRQRKREVLARHWPSMPRFGDIRQFRGDEVGSVDLVCGGFPCQDVSSAGRRAGLAGARSGLWWEFHRVLGAARPRWVLVENVDGLLSSNDGRDMGAVLGSLGDLGYGWAYRVLDAQHFGLAQRRRRVWIVGCLGDRAGPAQVLLEPESSAGDPAPSREARADFAVTLTSGTAAGRGVNAPGRRGEDDRNLIVGPLGDGNDGAGRRSEDDPNLVVAGTLLSKQGGSRTTDLDEHGAYVVGALMAGSPTSYRTGADEAAAGQLVVGALTGGVHGGADDNDDQAGHLVASALVARYGKGTLTAEGHDASEDGTGRGTPLVVADTLRSHPRPGSNTNGQIVYRKAQKAHDPDDVERWEQDEIAATLDAEGQGPRTAQAVVTSVRTHGSANANGLGVGREGGPSLSLDTDGSAGIANASGVRRLTPRECERLQGFPDDWTAGHPDSARYRMLGDAVPVPVVEWIGRRIVAADAAERGEGAA